MIHPILADATTSISELKKTPMTVVNGADGLRESKTPRLPRPD